MDYRESLPRFPNFWIQRVGDSNPDRAGALQWATSCHTCWPPGWSLPRRWRCAVASTPFRWWRSLCNGIKSINTVSQVRDCPWRVVLRIRIPFMRIRILLFTLMRIQIRILPFNLMRIRILPTHFFSKFGPIQCSKKTPKGFHLFTLMRIQLPKWCMQIYADPDPQHCLNVQHFKTKNDSDKHSLIPYSIKKRLQDIFKNGCPNLWMLNITYFCTFLRLLFYLCDSSLEVLSCKEDISVILIALAQKRQRVPLRVPSRESNRGPTKQQAGAIATWQRHTLLPWEQNIELLYLAPHSTRNCTTGKEGKRCPWKR